MKISEDSLGEINIIHMCLNGIISDKSNNSLKDALEIIESRIDYIKEIEGISD